MTPSRWTYFTVEELTCRCGCGQMLMDHEFMLKLVALRDLIGFPMPITSAYRCPAHNARVSSTGDDGPHTTGKAVDIAASYQNAQQIVTQALWMGFLGVGIKQHGPVSGRMVHLDMVPGPKRLWTYP
jgi:zinc D-Ala-D-Ala carboxypeptidase